MAPDAGSLSAEVAAALARLSGCAPAETGRWGVAVSGGPDSMALLDIMRDVAPGRVEAATVDHGLRAEAADEAALVARWCEEQGVSFALLRPTTPIIGSVQAEARRVRYALLDAWMDARGLDWLLTAHHADDQLETVLMRLNRGSGVSGLAGVRARRGRLLRPLLGVRKADLAAYVETRGIPHVADPSNGDARFDRARLRGALAQADWLYPLAAVRSAAALADAEAALDWTAERLWIERVTQDEAAFTLDTIDVPHEYLRRLLTQMMRLAAPDAPEPRGEQVEKAIVQLYRGRKLSIGACVVTGGPRWTVSREPPRRTG